MNFSQWWRLEVSSQMFDKIRLEISLCCDVLYLYEGWGVVARGLKTFYRIFTHEIVIRDFFLKKLFMNVNIFVTFSDLDIVNVISVSAILCGMFAFPSSFELKEYFELNFFTLHFFFQFTVFPCVYNITIKKSNHIN